MTSQTGQQIITIYIFHNISRSKGNQGMKFGQLVEYNVINTFFKNHGEDLGDKFETFLFFLKSLI